MEGEIRARIMALLDQHRIMTVATLRPDGWSQATTVGYGVNEGLTLYFLCGLDSPKAKNLARDDRFSLRDPNLPHAFFSTWRTMAACFTAASASLSKTAENLGFLSQRKCHVVH